MTALLEPVLKCRKSAPTAGGSIFRNARCFVPTWNKTMFPWVFLNERKAMHCQYCTDAEKANTFTWGCDKFKKDVLMKHLATVDHRAALEAWSGRRDQERAVAMANQSQQQAVIVALKTVYFMSKKNPSNDIFSDLKHFLFLQVHA